MENMYRTEHPHCLRVQDAVQESIRGNKISSYDPSKSAPPEGEQSPNACEEGRILDVQCAQMCYDPLELNIHF